VMLPRGTELIACCGTSRCKLNKLQNVVNETKLPSSCHHIANSVIFTGCHGVAMP
jgi:hypothetical protein